MFRFIALAPLLVGAAASAATVSIDVRGADGRPVPDAVVTIESARQPGGPIRFPWAYTIRQQDISFQPHVLIVPVGATVSFPNMDKVRHHVYSFSKPRRFQIKLYGHDQTRTESFDKPGVVAIGCNIHDRMAGFIFVTDSPYTAKSDAAGHVVLTGVPDGRAVLKLWSPLIRAPGNQLSQAIGVPAQGFARAITVAR